MNWFVDNNIFVVYKHGNINILSLREKYSNLFKEIYYVYSLLNLKWYIG